MNDFRKPMDLKQLKRELPNVFVRFNDKLWTARVTGRINKTASISPWINYHNGRFHTIIGPIYRVPWGTVLVAVNTGKPIVLENFLQIDKEQPK